MKFNEIYLNSLVCFHASWQIDYITCGNSKHVEYRDNCRSMTFHSCCPHKNTLICSLRTRLYFTNPIFRETQHRFLATEFMKQRLKVKIFYSAQRSLSRDTCRRVMSTNTKHFYSKEESNNTSFFRSKPVSRQGLFKGTVYGMWTVFSPLHFSTKCRPSNCNIDSRKRLNFWNKG